MRGRDLIAGLPEEEQIRQAIGTHFSYSIHNFFTNKVYHGLKT